MRLISVLLPDGREPTWRDTMVLNVGIAVLPEFKVELQYEGLDAEDAVFAPVVHMTLLFNFSEGRYTASFVGVSGHNLTGTDLREIRVAEVLRMAASAGIYAKLDKDDPPATIREWWGEDEVSFGDTPLGEMAREKGPVGWVLSQLSLVYNIAQVSSQPPAKAVEKAFGLPSRTAARWIAKAKEQGILKRPSVPGWEGAVEISDKLQDMMARGVPLVQRISAEEILAARVHDDGQDEHGEHPEAS